jgi:hypothetical protein
MRFVIDTELSPGKYYILKFAVRTVNGAQNEVEAFI